MRATPFLMRQTTASTETLVLRGTLQRDLLRLGIVPCAVVTLVLTGWFTRSCLDMLEATFNAEGQAAARQIAALSDLSLHARDLPALQNIADAALRSGQVTRIEISSDDAGVLVAAGRPEQPNAPLRSFSAPVTLRQALRASADAVPIGQVQALRDTTAHSHERLLALIAGIGIAAVALLGAWLSVRPMARSVARPLRRVLRTVAALEAGQFDARCDIVGHALAAPTTTTDAAPSTAGSHELATLAHEIDRMAERLQHHRHVCEERVREATAMALQRMAEAEQAALSRARFLAAASHDLRQPLHAMGLFIDGLLATAAPAQRTAVLRLQESTGFMGVLLDDLLNISRLDARVMTPTVADVPLAALFIQLDAQHGDRATAGTVRLLWRDGGLAVRSDAAMLMRLLGHLVNNAIRHAPAQGTVLVTARRRGGAVRIEVRDNGIGIAPAHQARIFEEFYQVANTERDPRQGFGLGLAICTRLAALLGTRIVLRSALQHGSTFALALPRGETMAPGCARPARHAAAASRLTGLRCLVVDDEPAILDASRALLAQWGCDVECVASVSDALARLDAIAFDVVLCDLQLAGDDDGMGVIEAAHRQQPDALAVLVAGATGPEVLQRLRRSGSLWLSKPVAPARLRALLSTRRRPA
jgi:signal transduction histidine kinase